MHKKRDLITGVFLIIVGLIFFLCLLIRFYNQGYFGGEPRVYYLFHFEMKDWFGMMMYSMMFSIAGFILLKNEAFALILCQFIAVGLVIDRIWYISERLNYVEVTSFLSPLVLLLLSLFYIMQSRVNFVSFLKKIGLIILINILILSIGNFFLPNV